MGPALSCVLGVSSLSGGGLCGIVCTRVLLHSVPLPLLPDPCIPTPQLVDGVALGSKRVN